MKTMKLVENWLNTIVGRIYRHDRLGNQTLICQATRLGNGMWLTVADRGIYGGVVYGQHQGTMVLVDLWLHPEDGRPPMPIQWASQLAVKPIAAVYVPQDRLEWDRIMPTPKTPMEYQFSKDYGKFFRLDETGVVREGSIYDRPWPQRYDIDRENVTAIVARGSMGYNFSRTSYGSPVVDKDGRLMGVIVGRDWGTDSSHAGFYIPIDVIDPFLALLGEMVKRKNNRDSEWQLNIESVRHPSHDVYFD